MRFTQLIYRVLVFSVGVSSVHFTPLSGGQIEREWRESLQAGMVEDREKMATLQRANEQLTKKLEVGLPHTFGLQHLHL